MPLPYKSLQRSHVPVSGHSHQSQVSLHQEPNTHEAHYPNSHKLKVGVVAFLMPQLPHQYLQVVTCLAYWGLRYQCPFQ